MKHRKAGVLILALTLIMSMASSVFAVSGAVESDRTDYVTDRTGNSTAERQANSSDVGTIRLGKILTVNQKGKFPNIEDFVYKITPIAAWDNANVSTEKSGANIAPEDMPRPNASTTAHHDVIEVKPDNLDDAPWATLVTIGNFKDADAKNTSSVTNSDAASNTDLIDAGKRRTRTTDVSFNFEKAGYYMYKIDEVGSRQNGGNDSLSALKKDVAGVDYDDNSYYVVFYVTNNQATADNNPNEYGQGTKIGDTTGYAGNGVYVNTITSWTNQYDNAAAGKNATDYKPDNSMRTSDSIADAQNFMNDLMEAQDVDSHYNTTYGDGGHAAQNNSGRVENDNKGKVDGAVGRVNGANGAAGSNPANQGPSTVTHDNLGKVGISTPEHPNFLEAYRMWNAQNTHDIVLKKNVTGNLGDLTKEFVFDVTLTGLEYNQTYTTDVAAGSTENADAGDATNDVTSAGVKMYDMQFATLADDGKSFTTGSDGKATFKVKLKDGDILVLNSLPRTASYQVTEEASDHVAQYNIVSTNKDAEKKAVFTETGHTPGGDDANHLGAANKDANAELATKVEFVDRYDGTVTVVYQNNRDLATLTGIAGLDLVVEVAALLIVVMAGILIIRRRREYAKEDI